MASPLTVRRNDYRSHPKRSDIATPLPVAEFICETAVESEYLKKRSVWDIGCGSGNLSRPFKKRGFPTIGIDVYDHPDRMGVDTFIQCDFLKSGPSEIVEAATETGTKSAVDRHYGREGLVICNPPFNTSGKRTGKLLPELYLFHILEVFGNEVPIVLFAPMGMLLNQRLRSSRWKRLRDNAPEITSIVSLPLDVFPDVEFHNLVLLFNMPDLPGHHFLSGFAEYLLEFESDNEV